MFMRVVNLKLVNKLDLTWKQSFLILVDSELFGRHSLYQFDRLFLKRLQNRIKHTTKTFNTVNIST
jgi:hypothetical protein